MFGLGGIFHTDELPAYGISQHEIEMLRNAVGAEENDAVVMAAGDAIRVERALQRIAERAEYCLIGVPEETRKANEDGTTSYLRPLPGAARMYPETDVPAVKITEEMLDVEIPELIEDRAKRYSEKYGLSYDLAYVMADSEFCKLFEEYAEKLSPTITARVLHIIPSELKKEGLDTEILNENHFRIVLELIEEGKIAKEGAEEALKILCQNPLATKEEIAEQMGKAEDLDAFIAKLVEEKRDFIMERGEHAFKPLMGLVMKEFRGKVDGKVIAEKLKAAIEKALKG